MRNDDIETDENLLKFAQEQGLILVTRDRDFGALVFVNKLGSGVIYLRILPSTQHAVRSNPPPQRTTGLAPVEG